MKSSQDVQKEIDYVMNFAQQMGVPDDVYFQFIAVADSYLRDGDYESAEQQVEQALLAAQSYGLKPEGTMKITESKLRRIIRKTIVEHGPFHGGHEGRGADMPLPTPRSNNKGYGWHDFKMMASEGDWEGCSDWLEDYCLDRGIRLYSEIVHHMCEYAADETVTEVELEEEMQAVSRMY